MNLEIIITTILAMLTSLIPFFYKKMTENTNFNMTSPYLLSAALILGINTAFFFLFTCYIWIIRNFIFNNCLCDYCMFYFLNPVSH